MFLIKHKNKYLKSFNNKDAVFVERKKLAKPYPTKEEADTVCKDIPYTCKVVEV